MRRSVLKRLLVAVLLVCKLVTAQFAFESMGMAASHSAMESAMGKAGAAPCPEHAAADEQSTHDESKTHDSCKSGACKCPCLHTPALAASASVPGAAPIASGVPLLYHFPSPPGSEARFFRPPILAVA